MATPGVVVLLADATCRHVVIEVAPAGASSAELATLTLQASDRVGCELQIHATLPTQDHAHAVAKARELLRYTLAA
jgi:hypothetical protein